MGRALLRWTVEGRRARRDSSTGMPLVTLLRCSFSTKTIRPLRLLTAFAGMYACMNDTVIKFRQRKDMIAFDEAAAVI